MAAAQTKSPEYEIPMQLQTLLNLVGEAKAAYQASWRDVPEWRGPDKNTPRLYLVLDLHTAVANLQKYSEVIGDVLAPDTKKLMEEGIKHAAQELNKRLIDGKYSHRHHPKSNAEISEAGRQALAKKFTDTLAEMTKIVSRLSGPYRKQFVKIFEESKYGKDDEFKPEVMRALAPSPAA